MTITERYNQAKKGYEYLFYHHSAHANDLTGGFVEGDKLFELLANPCKKEAAYIYSSLITHYASCGKEGNAGSTGTRPDLEDEGVAAVFRDNCDEDIILITWGVDIRE